jgi:cell division protein FtsB
MIHKELVPGTGMKRNFLLMRFFASLPTKYILCLGGAVLVGFLFVFFTARGIMQINQLKADRDRIKAVISQLREDNRKMSKEIESLNTLEGVEERARNLGLVGKGELLYIF